MENSFLDKKFDGRIKVAKVQNVEDVTDKGKD